MQLAQINPRLARMVDITLLVLIAVAALAFAAAHAGTDTTFNTTLTRITGWTQGSLGKLAAVAAISTALIGMVLKFDWKLIGGALGVGLTAATGSTITSGLVTAIL
jgi:conjugal transfer pilus assembly protein TraA